MFDFFLKCEKKFEGKWKGRGILIEENNNKIIHKKILSKIYIKKINNHTYKITMKLLINDNIMDIELLGFINKSTKNLEFTTRSGTSQFYFDKKHLINSFNNLNSLCEFLFDDKKSSGTIKFVPYKKHSVSKSSDSTKSKNTTSQNKCNCDH